MIIWFRLVWIGTLLYNDNYFTKPSNMSVNSFKTITVIIFFYSTTSRKSVITLRNACRQEQQDVLQKMGKTYSGLTGRKLTHGIRCNSCHCRENLKEDHFELTPSSRMENSLAEDVLDKRMLTLMKVCIYCTALTIYLL